MDTIQAHRRFYAEFIVKLSGSGDESLIAAFSSVPREDYLGPGPWPVSVASGYIPTLSAEPYLLYQDILIGLQTDRRINNGQPSLHAECLAAAAPGLGETVVHVGAGTGYYTAILATLVGPAGHVYALEIEPDLASRASANLAHFANVEVRAESANDAVLPQADLIYVNAGVTHPPSAWLDSLNVGGRLLIPLTPNEGLGVMLKITRVSANDYAAEGIAQVAFIPCIGARDDAASASLIGALQRQTIDTIRSLKRYSQPDSSVWCAGPDWWLSTADPQNGAA